MTRDEIFKKIAHHSAPERHQKAHALLDAHIQNFTLERDKRQKPEDDECPAYSFFDAPPRAFLNLGYNEVNSLTSFLNTVLEEAGSPPHENTVALVEKIASLLAARSTYLTASQWFDNTLRFFEFEPSLLDKHAFHKAAGILHQQAETLFAEKQPKTGYNPNTLNWKRIHERYECAILRPHNVIPVSGSVFRRGHLPE